MKEFDSERAMDLHREYGALSFTSWARVCLNEGVFSEEFVAKATLRAARSTLTTFAREEDDAGLPRLGQTTKKDEDGEPIVVQPDLWDRDDALLHIEVRLKNRDAQHLRLLKMVEWFEDRFGGTCPFRPQVERLPGLEYEDTASPWA